MTLPRLASLLPLFPLVLSLLVACEQHSDDEEASKPASASPSASTGGMGLVVVPEDPALRGIAPEELEARGIRAYFHDFGSVPVGSTVEHVFQLENTNPTPVSITRLQTSCGCTTAAVRYTGADGKVIAGSARGEITIPPGAIAEVTMRIDTLRMDRHNLDKLYTVQLTTDAPQRAYMRLEAHIRVENAFQATPMPIELGRVPKSGGGTGQTEIVPLPPEVTGIAGAGARVARLGPLPEGIEARLEESSRLGNPIWKCYVTLVPPLKKGPVLERFDILTEDAAGVPMPPVAVEVRAYVVDDIDWSPLNFALRGAALADGPVSATIELYSLLEGQRLKVLGTSLAGEGTERLELSAAPVSRDAEGRSARWTLTLTTKPPFGDATVRGRATVELEGRDPAVIDVVVHPR